MGAYRSKAPIVVQKKKAKPLLRNGEKAGLVLGAVLLVFSFIEGDVPLAFFLLSFSPKDRIWDFPTFFPLFV